MSRDNRQPEPGDEERSRLSDLLWAPKQWWRQLTTRVIGQAEPRNQLQRLGVVVVVLLVLVAGAAYIAIAFVIRARVGRPSEGAAGVASTASASGRWSRGVPSIALVGPDSGVEGFVDWFPVKNAILSNVQLVSPKDSTILSGSIHLRVAPEHGDAKESQQLALDLCADSMVVGVIGYVWSNRAESALSGYRQCYGRMPVFVVGATRTGLTQVRDKKNVRGPFLQLPLGNVYQARQITLGLGDTYAAGSPVSALLLKSQSNPSYVNELSRGVVALTRAYKKARFLWDSVVIDTLRDWTWQAALSSADRRRYDIVVYVGNVDRPFISIIQTRPPVGAPLTIVSDGAVNRDFLAIGDGAKCVWGAFPAPQVSTSDRSPTFEPFGKQALAIVYSWASEQRESGGLLARKGLATYVDSLSSGRRETLADGTRARFRSDGTSIPAVDDSTLDWPNYYHLMQVQRNSDGRLTWRHRETRSSLAGCPASR